MQGQIRKRIWNPLKRTLSKSSKPTTPVNSTFVPGTKISSTCDVEVISVQVLIMIVYLMPSTLTTMIPNRTESKVPTSFFTSILGEETSHWKLVNPEVAEAEETSLLRLAWLIRKLFVAVF